MKTITSEILDHMFARAKERMLQDVWKENEIDSFMNDPVIRLFYGTCAEEIEKVHEEIFHVEQRLINKTLEYLLPEEFQTPLPAHAIFHAQPHDKLPESVVWPECQFKLFTLPDRKEFVFAPAGKFTVFHAEIGYMIFRDRFFQWNEGNRVQLISGEYSNSVQDDILWLGIKDLNKILPKEKLSIFFALRDLDNEQYTFLNALKYCKCLSADGQLIKTSSGLGSDDIEYWNNMMKQPDYIIYKMFQHPRNWYQNHYLSLNDLPARAPGAPAFPVEISKQFPAGELEKIKDDIYWIKFSFSNLLKESWIQQLYCSINCFPAMNLKLEQEVFDIGNLPLNILSISSDDFILTIRNVTGKVRTKQEEVNYMMVDPELRSILGREGEALFRRGSLGRINAGKLKNMLNLLMNILKEETVLLTKDGSKEDIDKLNRLNRAAADFETSIEIEKEKKGKYSGNVILRAYKDQNRAYVRFWTTAAEEANYIKPLTGEDAQKQCAVAYAPDVSAESVKLITSISGGKRQPTDEEYIDTLRKHLLSRDRIVTVEDIKAFCYEYFSPRKVNVEVKKATGQSKIPGHGLVRTIDIYIRLAEKCSIPEEEILYFKEELLQKLEQHSANVLPFRIEIS